MTNSQRLTIRASEIREKLNELSQVDELSTEQRSELDKLSKEYSDVEAKLRASTIAESAAELRAVTDNEGTELRVLLEGASLGAWFEAVIEGRSLEGREAELGQHFKLPANSFPVEMLREPVEVRAVTPAPSDAGRTQRPIVQPVFAGGDAAFLGIPMPTVPVGDQVFPVLTSRPTVGGPHTDSTSVDETTGAFSADVLQPSRFQASFFWRRTDAARFAGLGESLRRALNSGLAEALDSKIIGQVETDVTRKDASAADTFATYRSRLVYGAIDGRWASREGDIRLLVGGDTLGAMAGKYRGNTADDSAADSLRRISGGLKVSAHIAATAAHKRDVIVRVGSRQDAVAPIWRGVSLIPDEVTKAKSGEIVVTAVMLAAYKVTRTSGFARVQVQHQ